MAVADYTASASTLSDGTGSFAEPPYGDAFTTTATQFTHSGGMIQRSGAGWGSFTWGTSVGPDTIAGFHVGATGESEFEVRGKDIASANWDAYSLYWDGSTSWELYRTINGSTTSLATGSHSVAVGDTIWFMAIGSGSSVELAAAIARSGTVYADFISTTDSTSLRLTNSGFIGAWANGTTFKIDTLYGATAVATSSGSTIGMSATVNAATSMAATGMVSTRGLSGAVNASTSMAASGMVASKGLGATVNASTSMAASGMVASKQLTGSVAAETSMSASMGVAGTVALDGSVAAATTMIASMRVALALTGAVAAESVFTASTLSGIATTGLVLTPVTDPGGLTLTPYSDPGGLVLTPYSDPGGLTLTPVT